MVQSAETKCERMQKKWIEKRKSRDVRGEDNDETRMERAALSCVRI